MKKNDKISLYKRTTIIQFFKFGIVGLSNTAISLLIYYIFIFINKDLYLLGNAVGFFVSTFNAYFWNHKFVFTNKKDIRKKFFSKSTIMRTYLSYMITFLLGSCFIYFLVDIIGVHEKIAPLINLTITIPFNFILNKFWVYRNTKEKEKSL